MFGQMFMFEWRYFTRQPSFFVTCLIFFLLTFFATISENVQIGGGGNVVYNGPYAIAQTLLVMGIFAMFMSVNFIANTALRNDSSKMAELLYSKPLKPFSYQLGRFLGSFAIVATVFAMVPLGIVVGCALGSIAGWVDVERLGTTQWSYYTDAYLFLTLPTLFVLSSFFYAIALKFRSMMGVYLSAVGLFILYIIAGQFFSEPEYRDIAALMDPFGGNAFSELTRYWTMHDKNNTAIEFSGLLLQNRVLWVVAGIVILALFGGFFSGLKLAPVRVKKSKKNQSSSHDYSALLGNNIGVKSSGINTVSHILLRIKFEIKQVIFSAPFLVLGMLTMFLLIAPMFDPGGMYGTPNWPLTQSMVSLIEGSTSLLMLVVMAYYSAEIVWRERGSGMGDIIDSMPVRNITFWLSKIIAISLVFLVLFVMGALVTMANQLVNGYTHYDIAQYAFRLGYVALVPLIMSAVLAFFLQVISPNKYIGMMLFVLYVIAKIVASNFGFSHNLYRFSNSPGVPFSDINQYGHFLATHNWYMLYWLGVTVVLAALGYGLWHRGPAQPLKVRIRQLGYQLGMSGKAVAAIGLIIAVSTGGYIHYNTRVLNDYVIQDDREQSQADYEKAFVVHKNDHLPTVIATKALVDIYPHQRRIEATAEITFTNTSDEPITRFLVNKPSHALSWGVVLEGGKLGTIDESYDHAWFEFDKPLMPNDVREGKLSVVRGTDGFKEGRGDIALVNNGTFVDNFSLFSTFGYQTGAQLSNRHKRRKFGLEPIERANKLEQSEFYNESFFGKGIGFMNFEAIVTTSEDQFAIAPGYLQSETVENGRRRFHYKMDNPIVNFYSIMSAKLIAKKEQYKGIDIEIYYHKDHPMNVDRMIDSVKDSIDYFSENFGPYQHKQLRIIEFPGYRSFAQSFANTVPYSERIGFISDLRDPDNIDPAYYVTAHEVAHQWWGHQVGAANVQGSAIISETLSQYSALMVMEKEYGQHKLRKFLKYELDSYLGGRASESIEEMPLMRSEGQSYIHYRKGSVVMMALRDRIGEDALNERLKAFLNKFKYQSRPYPTTLDLVSFLKQDIEVKDSDFISSLFEHITLYDLKITDVEKKPLDSGEFEVTLTIEAKQMRADGKGEETDVEFSDAIDIGLFNANPEDLSGDNSVIYLQKHELKTGENKITLIVKSDPTFAGVDPFVKLVDRDSEDNIRKL